MKPSFGYSLNWHMKRPDGVRSLPTGPQISSWELSILLNFECHKEIVVGNSQNVQQFGSCLWITIQNIYYSENI